jgi:hypothetical protein
VLLPVRRLEFKKKELTRKTYYPYIKKERFHQERSFFISYN